MWVVVVGGGGRCRVRKPRLVVLRFSKDLTTLSTVKFKVLEFSSVLKYFYNFSFQTLLI